LSIDGSIIKEISRISYRRQGFGNSRCCMQDLRYEIVFSTGKRWYKKCEKFVGNKLLNINRVIPDTTHYTNLKDFKNNNKVFIIITCKFENYLLPLIRN
jgi:hypothetical protein